jgi:hypothetical protein
MYRCRFHDVSNESGIYGLRSRIKNESALAGLFGIGSYCPDRGLLMDKRAVCLYKPYEISLRIYFAAFITRFYMVVLKECVHEYKI